MALAEVGQAMAMSHEVLRKERAYPAFIRAYNHLIDASQELIGILPLEPGEAYPEAPPRWIEPPATKTKEDS
jgi:hypothetical protein